MQPELSLVYVLTPPKLASEPKVEPHRVELDSSVENVFDVLRAAVETPSQANLRLLTDAVLKAHVDLLTLNFVESGLAQ
jgi:hypothetical protein